MNEAIQALESDHRFIKRMLRALEGVCERLERGAAVAPPTLEDVVSFMRDYADAGHHAKEEVYLFPALEKRGMPRDGGPIGVMLEEHVAGRELVGQMSQAAQGVAAGDTTAAASYAAAGRRLIDHLSRHIEKEEGVLFPMAAQLLDQHTLEAMTAWFQKVVDEKIGEERRAACEELAATLERQWAL